MVNFNLDLSAMVSIGVPCVMTSPFFTSTFDTWPLKGAFIDKSPIAIELLFSSSLA